ncbi:right-handed parallel beta-helix repeat-containing protein [Paenibacillus sp. LC-T2]|uniref:Right-handed parallel beta-helix repeat-containing protein n=1 Tax=Paenibacillus monticola TaxID=2666075 RepID=A0A7X2L529_9BACL|nr:right-handed parallel beta-helix repeat-containing protein [Paenibacillus monticola]
MHYADDTVSSPTVISLTDYGAQPDSLEDTQTAMQLAIEAAARISGPVVLDCPPGCYHFYPEVAVRAPYYISNTASEVENPDVTRTIGILLKGIHNLTLEGNGSLFVFHGKQTLLLLDSCTHVDIRNLHMDYAQPTVVEMTIVECGNDYFDVSVHPDSRYALSNGKLNWIGENWRFEEGPMQVYDPIRDTTWRIENWVEQTLHIEEIRPMLLRFYCDVHPSVVIGSILQTRDGVRDQVGVFIVESSDIRFIDVGMHFMHGLGMVGQFSHNLTFQRVDLSPRCETGRSVAGFADFIHLSGCRGKVRIEGSRFIGAQDDAINVHGTYLRIVGRPAANILKVRFMHAQTYGLQAFYPGDELDFIRGGSLTVYGSNRINSVEILNPRELLLTLVHPVPEGIGEHDVIENVTWTPEVEIVDNYFARIPTRGILVTTRRKVLIADNIFERMTMSAILIAVDAESWYESGQVEDVTITGNRFIECGSSEHPVIRIAPENSVVDEKMPVHRNITIEHNRFEISNLDAIILSAKSTRTLVFKHNEIIAADRRGSLASLDESIQLIACSEVDIADNSYLRGPMAGRNE